MGPTNPKPGLSKSMPGLSKFTPGLNNFKHLKVSMTPQKQLYQNLFQLCCIIILTSSVYLSLCFTAAFTAMRVIWTV